MRRQHDTAGAPAQGLKMIISAAALAAALGGWAALTAQGPAPATRLDAPDAALPPIPTLVPLVGTDGGLPPRVSPAARPAPLAITRSSR